MATIQGVYLALFGRPADPLGLQFFNGVTNNGQNLAGIGPLQSSAEYQAPLHRPVECPDHQLDLSFAVQPRRRRGRPDVLLERARQWHADDQ